MASWIPHNDNLIAKIPSLSVNTNKLLAEFQVLRENDEQESYVTGEDTGVLTCIRNAGMPEVPEYFQTTIAYLVPVQNDESLVNRNGLHIPDYLPELQITVKKLLVYLNFDLVNPQIMYAILKPNGLYRWHIDMNPQLNKTNKVFHIPLTSNEGCWMVYDNTTFHLPPDGSIYKVNNGVYHTYINAGPTERIHLLING